MSVNLYDIIEKVMMNVNHFQAIFRTSIRLTSNQYHDTLHAKL